MRKHSSPSASSCSKWGRRRLGTRPTFQKVSFLREELQLSIEICYRYWLSRSRQPNPPIYVVVIKMVLKISIYNIPYKVVEVSCLKTGINSPYVSWPFVYILAQLKQQHLLRLFKYKFNFIFLNSSFSTIKNKQKNWNTDNKKLFHIFAGFNCYRANHVFVMNKKDFYIFLTMCSIFNPIALCYELWFVNLF